MDPTGSVYSDLLELVRGRNYFVITTNVDHCFQKAGCDKQRLFYTQGDYGLWQCSLPCHRGTYDNEKTVRKMILAEGFGIGAKNELIPPQGRAPGMTVPGELAPRCPVCGRPMKMNLRSDDTFVEDAGWHRAAERYEEFMRLNGDRDIVYLEIGVGYNTPSIIKYPFWRQTYRNERATYICINEDAACPKEIESRSLCISGNAAKVIGELL